jgi:hypothetical protein
MLTPHIKRKKCKKQFYILPHRRPTMRESRCRERRKEKEEGRREKPMVQSGRPPRPSTGSRRPWVCETHGLFFLFFFFFFFSGDLGKDLAGRKKPTAGSCGKDLARDQTHRGDPPRSKSTTGHRDPRLGLAGVGLVFFFFPSGGSDFFFFCF